MSILSRVTDLVLPRRDNTTPAPTFPNFGELWNYITMNGVTYPLPQFHQTLHGDTETIDGNFESLVTQAFMSNPIVFGAEVRRLSAFSEVRFQWRNNRAGDTFGTTDLGILERPWTGGVTGDLLSRMLLYADFAGTSIVLRSKQNAATYGQLRVPRPDWCTLVMGSDRNPDDPAVESDAELIGVLYHPGGHHSGNRPEVFLPGEFAIFAPTPDPLARFRGIPWPAVATRDIVGDSAMSKHKTTFLANGATPNMVVTLDPTILQAEYEAWVDEFKRQEPKGSKAFSTLYLGAGAKVDVVGVDFQNLDYAATTGSGETRIAVASGVPSVIIGNSEGLAGSSLNEGNFKAAQRLFIDLTIRPLWRNACGSLEQIVPAPGGAMLWYDDRDVAFLREAAQDRATIQSLQAQTNRTLIDGGWEPDSIVAAILAEDWSLLKHSGLYSVQLQPPGTTTPEPPPTAPVVPPEPAPKRDVLLQLAERVDRLAERESLPPTITVTTPDIILNPAPVTVNIERGAVELSAPITVEAPEPPVVNVYNEPAEVTVEQPAITASIALPEPLKRTVIDKDEDGSVIGSHEELVDD